VNSLRVDLQIHICHLTPEKIAKWKGKNNFVHRLKVEMLMDVASQTDGNIVYFDGDTIIQIPVYEVDEKLSQFGLLLHLNEGRISDGRDPLSKKISKFLKKQKINPEGLRFPLNENISMYNAGVIGLTQDKKHLLPRVLSLTDFLYERYPKHIMEQLAFSYYFSEYDHCETLDKSVLHYWQEKDAYNEGLRHFFARNRGISEVLSSIDSFRPMIAAPKNQSIRIPLVEKIVGAFRGI
jgi:hypothetical protein